MTCTDIINKLKACSSEKHKANVAKMGIPEENSIGVSTADIRKLAKEIGRSNELAFALWQTRYHEARLLAVLLFDKKQLSGSDIECLMGDVTSWDLCDHLCKNVIIKMKDYDCFIKEWSKSSETYKLRAAFTLIASSAIHDDKLDEDAIDEYLVLIRECSVCPHEHVKKAVSWALREIGKIDYANHEKALILANELKENGNKTQIWIAKDALKEIENLVKVEGRKRLYETIKASLNMDFAYYLCGHSREVYKKEKLYSHIRNIENLKVEEASRQNRLGFETYCSSYQDSDGKSEIVFTIEKI